MFFPRAGGLGFGELGFKRRFGDLGCGIRGAWVVVGSPGLRLRFVGSQNLYSTKPSSQTLNPRP